MAACEDLGCVIVVGRIYPPANIPGQFIENVPPKNRRRATNGEIKDWYTPDIEEDILKNMCGTLKPVPTEKEGLTGKFVSKIYSQFLVICNN